MRHDQAKEPRLSIRARCFSEHDTIRSRVTALVVGGEIGACSDRKLVERDTFGRTICWESSSDAIVTCAVVLWIAANCEN